ncbi:MAG: DNA recombination protein RmuC [Deferribacterales bacterium]
MSYVIVIMVFIAGCLCGFGASYFLRRREEEMADGLKNVFAQVSMDSLSRNSEEFIRLAKLTLDAKTGEGERQLEGKKELIDAQLVHMKDSLEKLQLFMNSMEKERESKFAEISEQIKGTVRQTERLTDVANDLNRALSSSAERGRWGERMALDIIRAAGLIENVNYKEQTTMKNGSRPDFTFMLPKGLMLNMDVKFPLDNYVRFYQTEGSERDACLKLFIKDVKTKIKDVKDRGYVDRSENTLDVVLLFIPNESVYEFIYENDDTVMDYALANNVVLTSPMSLFAVLAVIRQSVENFAFESTSADMLKLFSEFYKQWRMFTDKFDTLGKRIDDVKKEFEALTTTRTKQLERPLEKIDTLRKEKGLELE